eukprot:scaffold205446_cov45-Tisochrysis_lutea.AAC.4
MQGTSDFSKLTALGLQQAVSTGDALCGLLSDTPVKAVYASPLSRAQHTLELVAGKWPAAATAAASHVVLEDLKEIELKEWSGRLSIDIKAEEPEAYRYIRCTSPSLTRAMPAALMLAHHPRSQEMEGGGRNL